LVENRCNLDHLSARFTIGHISCNRILSIMASVRLSCTDETCSPFYVSVLKKASKVNTRYYLVADL
jgi:hypothetical protein